MRASPNQPVPQSGSSPMIPLGGAQVPHSAYAQLQPLQTPAASNLAMNPLQVAALKKVLQPTTPPGMQPGSPAPFSATSPSDNSSPTNISTPQAGQLGDLINQEMMQQGLQPSGTPPNGAGAQGLGMTAYPTMSAPQPSQQQFPMAQAYQGMTQGGAPPNNGNMVSPGNVPGVFGSNSSAPDQPGSPGQADPNASVSQNLSQNDQSGGMLALLQQAMKGGNNMYGASLMNGILSQ